MLLVDALPLVIEAEMMAEAPRADMRVVQAEKVAGAGVLVEQAVVLATAAQ